MFDSPGWSFLARFGGPPIFVTVGGYTCLLRDVPSAHDLATGRRRIPRCARRSVAVAIPSGPRPSSQSDWKYVCIRARDALGVWARRDESRIARAAQIESPRKRDQDQLTPVCASPGSAALSQREGLMVGDQQSGYIVVPHSTLFLRRTGSALHGLSELRRNGCEPVVPCIPASRCVLIAPGPTMPDSPPHVGEPRLSAKAVKLHWRAVCKRSRRGRAFRRPSFHSVHTLLKIVPLTAGCERPKGVFAGIH
jgi:hypothetical protein